MRVFIGLSLLSLAVLVARADEALPEGAIRKGSLANAKLIADAKQGVAAKVGTMGCAAPERLEPFVVADPTGTPGQRYWKELWVVSGCGSKYPVSIEFRESGDGAADWTISR